MKKSLLTLALMSLCSTSFAWQENEGVELIKEEVKCKNTAVCSINFVEVKKKINTLIGTKSVEQSAGFPPVTINQKMHPNLTNSGNYYVKVYNNTNWPQQYKISYTISCDDYSEEWSRWYRIQPYALINQEAMVPLTIESKKLNIGKHIVYVSVKVQGYDTKNNEIENKDNQENGFLTIE